MCVWVHLGDWNSPAQCRWHKVRASKSPSPFWGEGGKREYWLLIWRWCWFAEAGKDSLRREYRERERERLRISHPPHLGCAAAPRSWRNVPFRSRRCGSKYFLAKRPKKNLTLCAFNPHPHHDADRISVTLDEVAKIQCDAAENH